MTTNKKLVVTVGVMAVALILALTGIIVVLVAANQRASSAVNVKYTASDVAVTLSATAYLGSNTHQFTKGGVVGGETELVLSPTVTEGSLSQTSDIASFDLSKTNDYVVFEYVFANNTDTIDVKIDQDGVPATRENINLTYTYSDAKITNFATLEDNAEFTAQLLPAYTGEETVKYVYIKAQIADLLYDSSLVGDFGWALSKPQDSEINTVTLSVANADYIERENTNLSSTTVTSDYTYKTFDTTINANDINIYPAVANKAFVGWSETDGGSAISTINLPTNDGTHNALRGTSAKTLYPVYKEGNVTLSIISTTAEVIGLVDSNATEVVIPDITTNQGTIVKVTKAPSSSSVFSNNTLIESVYCGRYYCYNRDSLIYFSNCTNLKNVTLPKFLKILPIGAFEGCSSLESIVIPDNFTYLYDDAFRNCTSLKSVTLPASLITVDKYAFLGCSNLEETHYKGTISSWVNITFMKSSSNPTTFSHNLYINNEEVTKIELRDLSGITIIRDSAFCGLSSLTSVVLPDTVTQIGESVFFGCTGLTHINIPDSVTTIDPETFYDCTNLQSVKLPTSLQIIPNLMFRSCTKLVNVNLPNNIKEIGEGAFAFCESLTTLNIPDSVSKIGNNAFHNCILLNNITLPKNLTTLGDNAFVVCSSLQSITIPSSITSISPYCFNGCASLKEVIIPEGITKIGEGAFYGCTGLGNITIAESVSQIDSQAFRGCSGLSFVNIPLGVNVIGAGAFMECSGLLIGEGIKIETRDFFYWEILNSGLRPDMNNPQNNAKMFVTDYWSSEWEKHQF